MDQFEKEFLQAHNDYRKKHGVPPLVYSNALSRVAQKWVDEIASKDKMQHSTSSDYGENIYAKYGTGKVTVNGKEAVDSWYAEIKDYVFSPGGFTMETGHFTQVVWKDTKEVGVGKATSKTGKVYVVANYSPAGNWQGQFGANVLPVAESAFGKVQGALRGVIIGGDSSLTEKEKDKQIKEFEKKIAALEKEVEDLKKKNFLLQDRLPALLARIEV